MSITVDINENTHWIVDGANLKIMFVGVAHIHHREYFTLGSPYPRVHAEKRFSYFRPTCKVCAGLLTCADTVALCETCDRVVEDISESIQKDI